MNRIDKIIERLDLQLMNGDYKDDINNIKKLLVINPSKKLFDSLIVTKNNMYYMNSTFELMINEDWNK